jgi:hypothetical protein
MTCNYYLSTQIPQQDAKHDTSSDVQMLPSKTKQKNLLPALKAAENK